MSTLEPAAQPKPFKLWLSQLQMKHGRKLMIALPYIWLILLFLLPFLIVFKISLAEMARAIPPYCNFAFFSGLISAQFWAGRSQPKSPELGANLLVMFPVFHSQQQTTGERIIAA